MRAERVRRGGAGLRGRQAILGYARSFSLGYFWYLRNDVVRPDGGVGYRNLRTRPSVQGGDYVTKFPYVRESKRLVGLSTITEEDILVHTNRDLRAVEARALLRRHPRRRRLPDRHQGLRPDRRDAGRRDRRRRAFGGDGGSRLAEIPLGALIPRSVDGLLAGGKNLSVSHIANGEYRIHPMEWNVGQAAGATAAMAVLLVPNQIVQPRTIRATPRYLRALQQKLVRGRGSKLVWANDVSDANRADPTYVAVMMVAGARVMDVYVGQTRDCHSQEGCDADDGQFRPAQALTRGEGSQCRREGGRRAARRRLRRAALRGRAVLAPVLPSIEALAERGIVGGFPDGTYRPDAPNTMTRAELAKVLTTRRLRGEPGAAPGRRRTPGSSTSRRRTGSIPFVARAKARGFLAGETTGSTFSPNTAVTRGSAARWAYNQMRWKDALP